MVRALVASAWVIVALFAPRAASGAGDGPCEQRVGPGPVGLPAPVVLTTRCGEYEVDAAGAVRFLGEPELPVPAGSNWFPADLSWYRFDGGRLLIGRGHELLWRSRRTFPGRSDVDAIALSANRVAFSLTAARRTTLYVAGIRGFERPIARGEWPLVWTPNGRLVTTTENGATISARGPRGGHTRTLARSVWTTVVDSATHRVYFVAGGVLSTFGQDGLRRLARLSRVGLDRRPLLSALAGMVAVSDTRRLVVFRSDGSRVSATTLPSRRTPRDWAPAAISARPDGTVAFTASRRSARSETVYLLRPGTTAAVSLYSQHVEFAECERMSELDWHGDWLLYSASEGYAAAIDSDPLAKPVDLSPLGRRLPGFGGDEEASFEASWASPSPS